MSPDTDVLAALRRGGFTVTDDGKVMIGDLEAEVVDVRGGPEQAAEAATPAATIDRDWLIDAIKTYQKGWERIGNSAKEQGNEVELQRARGAFVALRQVLKLLLNEKPGNDRTN